MGNRLSKIATRTGDNGSTGLGDGSRIDKDHLRIHAIGEIDELNANLGVLLCCNLNDALHKTLREIQQDLFDLGGELCIPGLSAIQEAHVIRLDELLAHYNATLPPLKNFILPGGTQAAALAHVCRTVCRRAERSIVSLSKKEKVHAPLCQYMNRLSDFLFVLARVLNGKNAETLWDQHRLSNN